MLLLATLRLFGLLARLGLCCGLGAGALLGFLVGLSRGLLFFLGAAFVLALYGLLVPLGALGL